MTVTHYFWDPVEDNVIEEYDENGDTIVEYETEPDLYGNLISQERDGVTSYYHFDGQGSTLALTNKSGDVTDEYAYNAFGGIHTASGTTRNSYFFIGERGYEYDSAMRRYSVRARIYTPSIGRWLSTDPIGRMVSSRAYSLYNYVLNKVLILIDPSGLIELDRVDPHTGEAKTIGKWVCRTEAELLEEHKKQKEERPFTSCVEELCHATVGKVWDSPRVRGCRSALDRYKNHIGQGHRCGDIIESPPSCNPDCQFLALYYQTTHSIVICADPVAKSSLNYASSGTFETQLEDTLCHELLHARQSPVCRTDITYYTTPDYCQNSLRRELQSYYCTSRCEWFWGCLMRVLRSSCPGSCNPALEPSLPTQMQINALYAWASSFYTRGNLCPPGAGRRT